MNRAPARLDRTVSLLLGLVLIVGGAILIDHRTHWLRDWPERADLASVRRVLDESWLPWVAGAAGLVLILLGLWLVLAQLRRATVSRIRLRDSDSSGSLAVDSGSLSTVVAGSLEQSGGIQSSRASIVDDRSVGQMVLARAQVDPRTDGSDLIDSARKFEHDVNKAFGGQLRARLLIDKPRSRRGRSSAPARVQ